MIPFDPPPKQLLSKEHIIGHLTHAKDNGWCQSVYYEEKPMIGWAFTVVVHELATFYIQEGNYLDRDETNVWYKYRGNEYSGGHPQSLTQLHEAIRAVGEHLDFEWGKPTEVKTIDSSAITNFSRISAALRGHRILGIHDPYFDNQALINLKDLATLGINIDSNLRVISSESVTGTKVRLTKTFFDSWCKENASNGEMRIAAKNANHQRFWLLDNNETLLLDFSFNKIAQNGVIRIENSVKESLDFESLWKTANNLT